MVVDGKDLGEKIGGVNRAGKEDKTGVEGVVIDEGDGCIERSI